MIRLAGLASLAILAGCASVQPTPESSETPAAAPATTAAPKKADFSRYLTTTICYEKPKHCIGPTAKALEQANVTLTWESFSKGGKKGVTAHDVLKIEDQGVPFTFEVRVTKPDDAVKYHVYMMLRSGEGTKRNGKVKTVEVADLKELAGVEFSDLPIRIKGGTIQVGAVLGQEVTITN